MTEFLPPSMHEPSADETSHPDADPASVEVPSPGDADAASVEAPSRSVAAAKRARQDGGRRPSGLGRLISLIVTVGLSWALTVAITAWLLGLFLARG